MSFAIFYFLVSLVLGIILTVIVTAMALGVESSVRAIRGWRVKVDHDKTVSEATASMPDRVPEEWK